MEMADVLSETMLAAKGVAVGPPTSVAFAPSDPVGNAVANVWLYDPPELMEDVTPHFLM